MKLEDLKQVVARFSYPLTPEKYAQLRSYLMQLGLDPDNLYQELEMSSRFVDTHRDVNRREDQVKFHSHTFYEVIYCRSGVQYLMDTRRYRLQRGDVVIVPPGVGHRPLLSEVEEDYRRYVLWLSQEFVAGLHSAFSLPSGKGRGLLFRTAGTAWEKPLGDAFRAGIREAEGGLPGWQMAVAGNTISLLALLGRAMADLESKPPLQEEPELLDEVMAYIEAHLDDKITLAAAAHRFWVSESTISQLFRRKMGVSFYRCVTQRRLISAKSLITDGVALETVSQRVGFRDYSTFYRAFRGEYGISPRQYRKMHESEGEQDLLLL